MAELDVVDTADLAAYHFEVDSHLALSSDAADLLFRNAHTANAFSNEPISDEQMQAIYELIKWAPTAMNTQPLRVALIRSTEARDRLVSHMAEGNKAKTVAAPLVAVLAADIDFHDELDRTFPVFPNAKAMFADETSRTQAAILNASLQVGYYLLGIRAAGLAAGPMGGFDADGVSQEFFPDGRHRAVVVVNIGRPSDESYRPRLPRLDYNEVVTTH